jgi:hypothetical protein
MSRTLILLGLGLPFYLNAPKESYAQPKCEDSQLPDYGSETYAYEKPPVWAQTGGERRSPPCKPEPAKPADGGARAKVIIK